MPSGCFEEYLGKFTENISFQSKKWLSQKGALKYSERLVFIPCLKGVSSNENMDWFKQLFFIKLVKGDKYLQNCFSPQSEPNTAKLCLTLVLKHFGGNS